MTEYWDNDVESVERIDGPYSDTSDTCIVINGSRNALDPGVSFKETVKSFAKADGMGKFRVFLNGDQIKPEDAPDIVAEGNKIELRPYDVAG